MIYTGPLPSFGGDFVDIPSEIETLCGDKLIPTLRRKIGKGIRITPFSLKGLYQQSEDDWLEHLKFDTGILYCMLRFLDIQNVKTKYNVVPPRLIKKYAKKRPNKCPRFNYRTMIIEFDDGTVVDLDGSETSERAMMGKHWTSATTRTYMSKEDGGGGLLFGKHAGTWLWKAHLRGTSKRGATRKTYAAKRRDKKK